jgi:hypothetical protein
MNSFAAQIEGSSGGQSGVRSQAVENFNQQYSKMLKWGILSTRNSGGQSGSLSPRLWRTLISSILKWGILSTREY